MGSIEYSLYRRQEKGDYLLQYSRQKKKKKMRRTFKRRLILGIGLKT